MADQPSVDGTRIIKRYSNRKLYDTHDSRYVTLQQIGEMVRRGEDVQIIDNKSKEDITEVTLALVISEELKTKPRSVSVSTLRNLIQERSERILTQLREGPIGRLIPHPEEGVEGETDPAAAPEQPTVDAAPPEAASEPDDRSRRGRINELVESSKHTFDQLQSTLDDRVRAVVPGLGLIKELHEQVAKLTQRVIVLEEKLARIDTGQDDKSS
jgi:polyhydroxyalkanoate synthesis repressor PhaR